MAPSPQLEDGFTKIAHEIMEALAKINLSPYESRVIWFLLRKTYGWKKKSDWIAGSQFRTGLGGLDRRHIWRAAKSLAKRDIIVISTDDTGNPIYSFQKDYSKWTASCKKMTPVISTDDKRHLYRHTLSSVEAHTKETLTKDKEYMASGNHPHVSNGSKNSNQSPGKDPYQLEFETQVKPAYPKRDGDNRWQQALGHYRVARRNGEPMQTILEGVQRYAFWVEAKGLVGTDKVKQAASFLGKEKCWREPWDIVGRRAQQVNGDFQG